MPGDIDSDWDVEMFKLFDMKCRVRIEDFQLRLLLTIILFFFLEKKQSMEVIVQSDWLRTSSYIFIYFIFKYKFPSWKHSKVNILITLHLTLKD